MGRANFMSESSHHATSSFEADHVRPWYNMLLLDLMSQLADTLNRKCTL